MSKAKRRTASYSTSGFRIEFMNGPQELAWGLYQQHEVLFLLGPAGTAKTHLAMAFAVHDVINHKQTKRRRVVMARPVVEAGEKLGFLPGVLEDKVQPYMRPLMDCLHTLLPEGSPQRDTVLASLEFSPLAYLRGRTFNNCVSILDEAQNASWEQLVMFLTRKGRESCKLIITGDPCQSDLPMRERGALSEMASQLETVSGTAIVRFNEDSIVRDDWVRRALGKIKEPRSENR